MRFDASRLGSCRVVFNPAPATLDRLAGELAAGRVTVPVKRTYELAEVADAFAGFAGGTLGKIAIAVA